MVSSWAGPTTFHWGQSARPTTRSSSTPSFGCAGGYAISTKWRVRVGSDIRMSTCMRSWGLFGSASGRKTFRGRKLDTLSESWMPEIGPSSSMRGVWKRSHGTSIETPPDERGGNSCDKPKATASHLYSTLRLITLRPRRFARLRRSRRAACRSTRGRLPACSVIRRLTRSAGEHDGGSGPAPDRPW